MAVNTFAHPYAVQLVALWVSFLPVAGMAALMIASFAKGDRGRVRLTHIRVPHLGQR